MLYKEDVSRIRPLGYSRGVSVSGSTQEKLISQRSKASGGYERSYRCLERSRCLASREKVPLWRRCVRFWKVVLEGREIFRIPKNQVRMKMQLAQPQLVGLEILVIFWRISFTNFSLNLHRINVSFLLLRIPRLLLIWWCNLVKDWEPRGLMRVNEAKWGLWAS